MVFLYLENTTALFFLLNSALLSRCNHSVRYKAFGVAKCQGHQQAGTLPCSFRGVSQLRKARFFLMSLTIYLGLAKYSWVYGQATKTSACTA